MQDKNLESYVLSRYHQKGLFMISYYQEAKETKRLVNRYYKIKWGPLKKKIKEILVDLKYRGDFRPTRSTVAMNQLKAAVKKNSIRDLKKVMESRSFWAKVPYDRFKRRRDYLK